MHRKTLRNCGVSLDAALALFANHTVLIDGAPLLARDPADGDDDALYLSWIANPEDGESSISIPHGNLLDAVVEQLALRVTDDAGDEFVITFSDPTPLCPLVQASSSKKETMVVTWSYEGGSRSFIILADLDYIPPMHYCDELYDDYPAIVSLMRDTLGMSFEQGRGETVDIEVVGTDITVVDAA